MSFSIPDISALKTSKGYALQDILTDLVPYVQAVDFPSKVRIYLTEKLADLEYRLASGTNERMQLAGMVGIFAVARDMTVK